MSVQPSAEVLRYGSATHQEGTAPECSEEAAHRRATVTVLRSAAELEPLRQMWTAWNVCPTCDFDFFLTILKVRTNILRPHVIAIFRGDRLEALLVGRLEDRTLGIDIGYLTVARRAMRVLTFLYGGAMGNLAAQNCDL